LYQHFKRTNSLKPAFEVHFLTFSKPFEAGRRRKLTRCFKEFNIYLLYLLYWCMTFVAKRNEIYQEKHKRSKNNQWRGKNQRNIEWLVRLFIDLSLDAFLLQNFLIFRFVSLYFVSFRFRFSV
jgi:hypothetical protein